MARPPALVPAPLGALLLLLLAALAPAAAALGPEPVPQAWLRVYNASPPDSIDAAIADRRFDGIDPHGASGYATLVPGPHRLELGGQALELMLQPGRWYTAVRERDRIRLLDTGHGPQRLHALVLVYNLVDGVPLSLRLADGRPVIDVVAPDQVGARELAAVRASFVLYDGERKLLDLPVVHLQRGRSFSLFVSGPAEMPAATWITS